MEAKKIFRWFGIAVFGISLTIALVLLANSAVFTFVTSNPEKMKQIAVDSGVYQKLPSVVYDETAKNTEINQAGIDLSDPKIKSLAVETFNPEFFHESANSAIDGTYSWLGGKSAEPNFNINLEPKINKFVGNSVNLAAENAKNLPVCTYQQLQKLKTNTNIFDLECIPPGIDIKNEAAKAKELVLANKEFASHKTLSSKDIKDSNGKPLFKNVENAAQVFDTLKLMPLVLMAAALVFAGLIFAVSSPRRRGLDIVSKALFLAGLFILFAPFWINVFTKGALNAASEPIVNEVVRPLVIQFNAEASTVYYTFAGLVILTGIIMQLIYKDVIKLPKKDKK